MGNFYNFKTFPYLGKLQDFSHLGKIHFDQNWGVLPYSLGLYLTALGGGLEKLYGLNHYIFKNYIL